MGLFPLEDVGAIKSMSAFEGARSALPFYTIAIQMQ